MYAWSYKFLITPEETGIYAAPTFFVIPYWSDRKIRKLDFVESIYILTVCLLFVCPIINQDPMTELPQILIGELVRETVML